MARLFNRDVLSRHARIVLADREAWLRERHAGLMVAVDFQKGGGLRVLTEQQIEQTFCERILGDVLGYPSAFAAARCSDGSHALQPKDHHRGRDGARWADFGLGWYRTGREDRTHVTGELKGPGTDLDANDPKRDETAIEQAFSAVVNSRSVKWVIASNIEEVRLYARTSQRDYERFRLRDLRDFDRFVEFYTVLARENLLGAEAERTRTMRMLEESELDKTAPVESRYTTHISWTPRGSSTWALPEIEEALEFAAMCCKGLFPGAGVPMNPDFGTSGALRYVVPFVEDEPWFGEFIVTDAGALDFRREAPHGDGSAQLRARTIAHDLTLAVHFGHCFYYRLEGTDADSRVVLRYSISDPADLVITDQPASSPFPLGSPSTYRCRGTDPVEAAVQLYLPFGNPDAYVKAIESMFREITQRFRGLRPEGGGKEVSYAVPSAELRAWIGAAGVTLVPLMDALETKFEQLHPQYRRA